MKLQNISFFLVFSSHSLGFHVRHLVWGLLEPKIGKGSLTRIRKEGQNIENWDLLQNMFPKVGLLKETKGGDKGKNDEK
jgi:hypothetical protein